MLSFLSMPFPFLRKCIEYDLIYESRTVCTLKSGVAVFLNVVSFVWAILTAIESYKNPPEDFM